MGVHPRASEEAGEPDLASISITTRASTQLASAEDIYMTLCEEVYLKHMLKSVNTSMRSRSSSDVISSDSCRAWTHCPTQHREASAAQQRESCVQLRSALIRTRIDVGSRQCKRLCLNSTTPSDRCFVSCFATANTETTGFQLVRRFAIHWLEKHYQLVIRRVKVNTPWRPLQSVSFSRVSRSRAVWC